MALTSVRQEESVTFLVPQSGEKSQIWTDYQSLIKKTNKHTWTSQLWVNTNIPNGDAHNFFQPQIF